MLSFKPVDSPMDIDEVIEILDRYKTVGGLSPVRVSLMRNLLHRAVKTLYLKLQAGAVPFHLEGANPFPEGSELDREGQGDGIQTD